MPYIPAMLEMLTITPPPDWSTINMLSAIPERHQNRHPPKLQELLLCSQL